MADNSASRTVAAQGAASRSQGEIDVLRHHRANAHMDSAFGNDPFGKLAETFARFFGTPKLILGQTVIVVVWIVINATGIVHFDLYPFILLNLAFSTQAAYAAPLILLAATRQAERDKASIEADARHREELHNELKLLVEQNTALTQQIHELTQDVREHLSGVATPGPAGRDAGAVAPDGHSKPLGRDPE